jgi:superfamily II DNA or RNA helicase
MNLKNLQSHPEQSNYTTSTGEKLFKYQDKALKTLKKSYANWLKNGQVDLRFRQHKKFADNKLRMLALGTGDGKSFMIPSAIVELTNMYFECTGEYCKIMIASPLDEVIIEHKMTMLNDFRTSDDGKNYEIFVDKDAGMVPHKRIDELIEGKIKVKDKHTIILLSTQYLNGHSKELSELGINIIIVDEAKGLNFGSDDEARNEGDRYPLLAWWDSIQELKAYIVVLNATPSTSHTKNDYDNYEILDVPDEEKLWKYPWIAEMNSLSSEVCKDQKIELLKQTATKWVIALIEHNYNFDYLSTVFGEVPEFQEKKEELRLITTMMKCSGTNTKAGITVKEAKGILEDLNERLKGTKVKIFDNAKKEFIEVLYDKDWICPIIKDQHNTKENVIAKMNDPQYPDNFLLVCEIGTYGINIPSLSLLFHSRDTRRHTGKTYTVEQLLGRLTRNRFIDNYELCDFIVSLNPDIEHYRLLKKLLMNLTKKSVVLFSSVKVNKTATRRLQNKLPDESDYSEMVDKILLDYFNWIPHDKDMMNSSGSDIERSYEDTRTDKCDLCDNAVFNAHENKLIDRGYSLVEARFLSVKQIMENAHTHTRDDGTQRSICKSCHQIETMENKHYLASDHPDRKKVDA